MNLIAQRLVEAEMKLAGVLPEHHDIVGAVISQKLRQNDDGGIDVVDDAGNIRIGAAIQNMTLAELLAEVKRQNPVFFTTSDAAPSKPASETMTARMAATIAAQKVDRKGQAAEIAKAGNPWVLSNRNVTRQMQITKLDPELATRLRQEARQ